MKEYISIGKNVDIAIEEGLRHLNLDREDVDIKILETGGLFKKAKVCLQYEEKPLVNEVEEIKEEIKPEIVEEVKIEQVENNVEVETESKQETENEVEEIPQQEIEAVIEKVEPIKAKDPSELIERVKQFLLGLASKLNIQVQVEFTQQDNDLNFSIIGDNVGKLIGYRGEGLNAIQNLLSTLKQSGEGRYRIYLDIAGYKSQREQTLVDLANKMADKAEEIERNVHLDPMNAYERRVIHTALQDRTLVETESMGEGEKRHVVIKFKR